MLGMQEKFYPVQKDLDLIERFALLKITVQRIQRKLQEFGQQEVLSPKAEF